jgi:hypothetical protein
VPLAHLRRKKALVCLSTTLSLLLLALSAWSLPRAFRLHQPDPIRQLETPAADFLSRIYPNSHLEVVQEFPLHVVVTADTNATTLERLGPALRHLYNIEEFGGEQLLVVPGRPPFYWSDHRRLALGVTLAGLLFLLPGLVSGFRTLRRIWSNRSGIAPSFEPARGRWRRKLLRGLGLLCLLSGLLLQWLPLWSIIPLLVFRLLGRPAMNVERPRLLGATLVAVVLSCYKRRVVEEILAAMPEREREESRRLLAHGALQSGLLRRQALAYFAHRLAQENGHFSSDGARFAAVLSREIPFPASTTPGRKRRQIYTCPTCEEVFIDEESLGRHQKTHLPPLVVSPPRPGPGRITGGRLAKALVALGLLLATGAASFEMVTLLQRIPRPDPSLSQWLQNDLHALVSSPIQVAVLEREGEVSALVAADSALHPLIQSRAVALGMNPHRLFCLPLENQPTPLWPWAGVLLLAVPLQRAWAELRRRRRPELVVERETIYCPPPPVPTRPGLSIRELMRVEDVQLEISRELRGLVDPNQGAKLLDRMTSIRRHVALELGLVVPKIHVCENLQLKSRRYLILVRGCEVGHGEVMVNQFLAIGPEEKLKNLRGTKTVDPTYGMPGVWISPDQRGDAERLGCMIFDPVSVIATQIVEAIRRCSADLLTFQAATELLQVPELQAVLGKLEERGIDLVRIWQTLRELLREHVSIRDLQSICDGLLASAHLNLDDEGLLDYARRSLATCIAKEYMNNEGTIQCWILPQEIQQDILDGKNTEEIAERLARFTQKLQERGLQPVFVSEPRVRRRLLALLPKGWRVVALSTAEIPDKVNLNNLGE